MGISTLPPAERLLSNLSASSRLATLMAIFDLFSSSLTRPKCSGTSLAISTLLPMGSVHPVEEVGGFGNPTRPSKRLLPPSHLDDRKPTDERLLFRNGTVGDCPAGRDNARLLALVTATE